jgi:hypothetical protein
LGTRGRAVLRGDALGDGEGDALGLGWVLALADGPGSMLGLGDGPGGHDGAGEPEGSPGVDALGAGAEAEGEPAADGATMTEGDGTVLERGSGAQLADGPGLGVPGLVAEGDATADVDGDGSDPWATRAPGRFGVAAFRAAGGVERGAPVVWQAAMNTRMPKMAAGAARAVGAGSRAWTMARLARRTTAGDRSCSASGLLDRTALDCRR